MSRAREMICFISMQVCALYLVSPAYAATDEIASPIEAEAQLKLDLPEDTSPRFTVKEIRISGNTLLSTEELLKDIPPIYDASGKGLAQAEAIYIYDFRILSEIIKDPTTPRQISARTIRGFTQYLLSVYQRRNYAGIYVYVPSDALVAGKELEGGILPVKVIEAPVTDVTITYYNPEKELVEKGYLKSSVLQEWSPVKPGQVANRKELDDFVNLLNLNPDRYISPVISKGAEPNSLSLGYNVYESDPWHYFVQVDNSGTKERQWAPRSGLINTNLFGFDDKFTAIYQAPLESDWDENYAVYGSYDFPLMGPKLRLNLYGGYSEFDISSAGDIDFLGRGTFYGGTLRYNVMQLGDWFFDVTGTLSHEESKVTPSIFPEFLESDVDIDLLGYGTEIYRREDMFDTSFGFNAFHSIGGSDQSTFWDSATGTGARTNADRDFSIYTINARHSQYLDPDKVQRLSGTFNWITSDERLVPVRMTTFGGMYSVRGYDEYEIVADGGILTSFQYEFDLVKYNRSKEASEGELPDEEARKPYLRKLAPLVFFDYGLAKMKDAVPGEHKDQELSSLGIGTILELGDNFTGAVYYGYPLIPTDDTRSGKGRLNVGLMMRW